jgi:hypothetical protein
MIVGVSLSMHGAVAWLIADGRAQIRFLVPSGITLARGSFVDSGKLAMPIQTTLRRAPSRRSAGIQSVARRVNFSTVGQCFEIEVTRETDGWLIRIPEIGGLARASRRSAVELAARECIAARTGIPIGYVTVFVASETG